MTVQAVRKSLLTAAAVGMLATSLATSANAITAPRIADKDEVSMLTVVRDGCGFRRHFDRFLGRCVWDRYNRRR